MRIGVKVGGSGKMENKQGNASENLIDLKNVENVSSEELALGARSGDASAFEEIAKRYEKAIRAVASTFHVPEAERDDLFQEGLIALYRAVCRYDETQAKFSTYAGVCIKRAMLTWIRDNVSRIGADGSEITEIPLDDEFEAFLPDESETPEELYITKEALANLKKNAIKKLSDYEKCVFLMYLEDMNVSEISEALGRGRKSVENALDRIRKKLSD